MSALSSSGGLWTEEPSDGVATTAAFGVVVDLGGGVYEIAASGTPAASLVSDGLGGYVITLGVFTGTGVIAFVGSNAVII